MARGWNVYVRGRKALLPTTAKTEVGLRMHVDPVEVVDVVDREALEQAIVRMIERGNPRVSMPSDFGTYEPVVLKHAGVKSWSTFARRADAWVIEEIDSGIRIGQLPRSGQGWGGKILDKESFPVGTSILVVARRLAERLAKLRKK